MFLEEIEFCRHLLRECRRTPAPGKLLSIQKLEAPKTVSQLREFLGLTNYYSGYVPKYAVFASTLMEKLKVNKEDGRKGSTKALNWSTSDLEAFEETIGHALDLP